MVTPGTDDAGPDFTPLGPSEGASAVSTLTTLMPHPATVPGTARRLWLTQLIARSAMSMAAVTLMVTVILQGLDEQRLTLMSWLTGAAILVYGLARWMRSRAFTDAPGGWSARPRPATTGWELVTPALDLAGMLALQAALMRMARPLVTHDVTPEQTVGMALVMIAMMASSGYLLGSNPPRLRRPAHGPARAARTLSITANIIGALAPSAAFLPYPQASPVHFFTVFVVPFFMVTGFIYRPH